MSQTDIVSPDGKYRWDGQAWQPIVQASPPVSPDGKWWWDGQNWQPMPPTQTATAQPVPSSPAANIAPQASPARKAGVREVNVFGVSFPGWVVVVILVVVLVGVGFMAKGIAHSTNNVNHANCELTQANGGSC